MVSIIGRSNTRTPRPEAVPPPRRDLLQRIARLAIIAPRRTIAIAVLLMAAAGIFGVPVAKSLSAGGFQDPTSESARATQVLVDEFAQGDVQLLLVVSAPGGADSAAARGVGTEIADQLAKAAHVTSVSSAWTAPPVAAASLVSKDGKSGLIVAGIGGGESQAQAYADELSSRFAHDRNGVTVRAGGVAMVNAQITAQAQHDMMVMEAIAIPLSFLVLVWVFGGLLAAAVPIAIGGMSILGALAVLRLITFTTDVSIFALNLSTALGLALAIDYTLLIISRYRDEMASGATRDDALMRTMATAGRTVSFSATTVALSMAAMILFPMHFLKSFGYAGIATVAFTAIAAVVITPAAIVLLGDRLNALDVRRLGRRVLGGAEPVAKPVERQFWYRSTTFVMRRALPIGLAVVALLVMVGVPFLGVRWGFPDDRVLPTSASAREVGDQLRSGFATDSTTAVSVVVPDASGLPASEMARYATDLSLVADVSAVSAPVGTFVAGKLVGPPSAPTGVAGGSALLTVSSSAPLFSDRSEAQLDRLHGIAAPDGRAVELTGTAQDQSGQRARDHLTPALRPRIDCGHHVRIAVPADRQRGAAREGPGAQRALADRGVRRDRVDLPGPRAQRSRHRNHRNVGRQHAGVVVLHRLRASDGLRGLRRIPDPRVLAGLRSHQGRSSGERRARHLPHGSRGDGGGARHVDLVRRVDRFARVLHADVRVGLTLAVIVDATLVRMVLLPAFMQALGTWAWWAPRSLVRLHDRFGISEGPAVSAAVHVVPRTSGRHRVSGAPMMPPVHALREG